MHGRYIVPVSNLGLGGTVLARVVRGTLFLASTGRLAATSRTAVAGGSSWAGRQVRTPHITGV